jgi:indole-3-glycerol phosphate synthase
MNILDQIIESKREEVKDLKKTFSNDSYQSMEFYESEIMSFTYKLNSNNKISLICEI